MRLFRRKRKSRGLSIGGLDPVQVKAFKQYCAAKFEDSEEKEGAILSSLIQQFLQSKLEEEMARPKGVA